MAKITRKHILNVMLGIVFCIVFFMVGCSTVEKDLNNVQEDLIKQETIEDSEVKNLEGVENYVEKHNKSEYADFLYKMENAFWEDTFVSVDEIEDMRNFVSWCISIDYVKECEGWFNESLVQHEVPGKIVRDTICKYLEIDEVDLSNYFPTQQNYEKGNAWYSKEKDVYYSLIGGFGTLHDGYTDISTEVLGDGYVKVIGRWSMEDGEEVIAEMVIVEKEDESMRVKSYNHTINDTNGQTEEKNNNLNILENDEYIDATKGEVTLKGTLEWKSAESSSGSGMKKEMYVLHIEPAILEFVYYDYDTEQNVVEYNINEIDVNAEIGDVNGQYDGYQVSVTGEIYPNYTAHAFNWLTIKGNITVFD